jgi:hypothetical protein
VDCDILSITLKDGTEREIIFDISLFFGKKRRKSETYSGSEYCNIPALTKELESLIAEFENSEDDDFSAEDYEKNIEENMAKEKIRHDAYLLKLKSLALNNPEYPALLEKYAFKLSESIARSNTPDEAKLRLDEFKTIMLKNQEQKGFLIRYAWSIRHYLRIFNRFSGHQDLKTEEEIIELIYALWQEHPGMHTLL